jgi:glutamyl-tRNA reductase
MTVLIVGLNHRTAPVRLLERATVAPVEVPEVLNDLLADEHVAEAAVLSTCNRVEVYAWVTGFHGGLNHIGETLARRTGMHIAALAEHLYVSYADEAVRHLFTVTAGLDSLVVGETQVLGQVRDAYGVAAAHNAAGRRLHDLMQRALRSGKRVHTETPIDRAGQSVVSAALALGTDAVGPLTGKDAAVVGAGSMGGLAAASLRRAGVGGITLVNRTPENAEKLAASVDGRVVGMEGLAGALTSADVVVAATGSTGAVLDTAVVAAAVAERPERPLLIVDLGVPRDVERGVDRMDGVTVVDIESLTRAVLDEPLAAGVEQARGIVDAEVEAFVAEQATGDVAPTVVALRAHADGVVDAELNRLAGKVPSMEPAVRAEVERTVRRVVATLLHMPTVRVKELAGGPDGDRYAVALRELFGLDVNAASATATVIVSEAVSEHDAVPSAVSPAAAVSEAGGDGR